jgi:DNA-directed RNA polymerase II subunit RPB2
MNNKIYSFLFVIFRRIIVYMETAESMLAEPAMRAYLIESMFAHTGFARAQIESFEHFMRYWIPRIVEEMPDLIVEDSKITFSRHVVKYGRVSFSKPIHRESDGSMTTLYPFHARWRNLTYAAGLHIDTIHEIYDIRDPTVSPPPLVFRRMYRGLHYGDIPVMRRSSFCWLYKNPYQCNECPFDGPGNFVVNGKEKNVLGQLDMRSNKLFVWLAKNNKALYKMEIRSQNTDKIRSTSTLLGKMTRQGQIFVSIPFIKKDISLPLFFRSLGIDRIETMLDLVLPLPQWRNNERLRNIVHVALEQQNEDDETIFGVIEAAALPEERPLIINSSGSGLTAEDLQDWIGCFGMSRAPTREKRIKYVQHIFGNEFLPHMGIERNAQTLRKKCRVFGGYIRELCMTRANMRVVDDIDHAANKRILTICRLMAYISRPLLKDQQKMLGTHMKRAIDHGKVINQMTLLNDKRITARMRYHFSTGLWDVTSVGGLRGGHNRKGVAQKHERTTVAASISNLRRISTKMKREGRSIKERLLHLSHWGVLCCYETPEGTPCGQVINLALGAHVRIGCDPRLIIQRLLALRHQQMPVVLPPEFPTTNEDVEYFDVLVNGTWIGHTPWPELIVTYIRAARRSQHILFDTSVTCWSKPIYQVSITTDDGALMRPCFVLENLHKMPEIYRLLGNQPAQFWRELLLHGVIEYLDKEEEMTVRVAMQPQDLRQDDTHRYTHLEIDPTFIMGIVANMLPFSEHNQAPRNTLFCAMNKQAMAGYALNAHLRPETLQYHLWYPQRPLVRTAVENVVSRGMLSCGLNAKVMICIYTGYDQEDSFVLRQGWVERGPAHVDMTRTYMDEEKGRGMDTTRIEKPDVKTCRGVRNANYEHLGEDGVPPVGTVLLPGDVIIGKTLTTNEIFCDENGDDRSMGVKRDQSQCVRDNLACFVDQVIWTTNRDGTRAVRVITRSLYVPIIGDKLAMRHGQKGTVGMIMRDEDMPFLVDGREMPDVLINVHMFPSRMTIGLLCEMHLGTLAATLGKEGDGMPFRRDMSLERFSEALGDLGYRRYGKYAACAGTTGEPIQQEIYMGTAYLYRLKHLAADKAHVRNTGPVQITTRQPVEGRAKDGGLRFGEMEVGTNVAHGTAQTLKETILDRSDPCVVPICEHCGLPAEPARPTAQSLRGMVLRAQKPYCRNCDSTESVRLIQIPYGTKLWMQEIMATGQAFRLRLSANAPSSKDEDGDLVYTHMSSVVMDPLASMTTADKNKEERDF